MLRSRRRHAQELVNRCDSRATPGRPPQPPVAKSAGSEHVAAGAPRRADSIRSLRPTKRAKATEGFARVKSALLHRSRRHHSCALRQGLHPQPVDDPHQLFEPHLVEMA